MRRPLLAQDKLHITLQWLAFEREAAHRFVPIANEIVSNLQTRYVDISLTKALSFRGKRDKCPLVLSSEPSKELKLLFDDLGQGMKAVGLRFASRSLTPHMTLLYDATMVAPEPIQPITWRATELLLVHSRQGLGRHDVLGRWQLG